MKRKIIITKEELDRIHYSQMKISAKAVQKYPKQYQELRSTLEEILARGLDISKYHKAATKIASLLKPLFELKAGSIFYYPHKNISPEIYGRAENLIKEVKQLLHQMDKLDAWIKHHQKPQK